MPKRKPQSVSKSTPTDPTNSTPISQKDRSRYIWYNYLSILALIAIVIIVVIFGVALSVMITGPSRKEAYSKIKYNRGLTPTKTKSAYSNKLGYKQTTIQKGKVPATVKSNQIRSNDQSTLERLAKDYDIIVYNVDNLEDAKYFISTEKHDNMNHQRHKKDVVSQFGNPGDELYFDGLFSNQTFPCNNLCLDHEGSHLIYYKAKDKNNCNLHFEFSNKLHCQGIEGVKSLTEYDEFMNKVMTPFRQLLQDIYSTIKLTQDFLLKKTHSSSTSNPLKDVTEIYNRCSKAHKLYKEVGFKTPLPSLKELSKAINNANFDANLITNLLIPQVTFLMEQQNAFNEKGKELRKQESNLIKERNSDYIETFKRNKTEYKKFGFFGTLHLVPRDENGVLNPLADVSEADHCYELRQFLAEQSSVIFIPKEEDPAPNNSR
jgi:hypothetical protein